MSIWEIERKYRIPTEVTARQLMAAFRSARLREQQMTIQRDEYYDNGESAVSRADFTVRLRDMGEGNCMIALKGPRELTGATYSRIELEFTGVGVDQNRAELRRFGLEPQIVIEKRRYHFYGQHTTMVVDEVARLGWFCEVEGRSDDDLDEMAVRFGLLTLEEVTANYTELLRVALGIQTGGFHAVFTS
jgi:predicted adenylyl cyclase CyaB